MHPHQLFSSRTAATIAVLLILVLLGCGGSGSGNPIVQPVSITIAPSTPTVTIPNTQTFTALVSNTSNTAVAWSIEEGSTGGTISSEGVYSPPNHTGTFHVTAKAQADTSKSATATITVVAPAPVISSTPPTAAVSGTVYSYSVTASDPGGSGVTLSLTTAPAGATLAGTTISWTPDSTQARNANNFSLKAMTGLGMSSTQNWSVTPAGDVTVSGTVNYYSEAGLTQDPYYVQAVDAVVPGQGGLTKLTPTINGDTATFTNLPAGYYWLRPGGDWLFAIWTNVNHYDLSVSLAGRKDMGFGSGIFTFNLNGLMPLTTKDAIDFFNYNGRAHFVAAPFGFATPGSTTATYSRNWSPLYGIADASKGDKVWMNQLSAGTFNGETIQALSASTGALSETQVPGGNSFNWSFTPVGMNSVLRANIKGSAFEALIPKMGTGTTSDGGYFYLDAEPESVFQGVYSPTLVRYYGALITSDKDFGDIAYGNPFPADWALGIFYEHSAHLSYQLPGSTALSLGTKAVVYTTSLPTATSPLQPLVGPPENPKVGNLPLTATQSGVGLSPTISWTPPTVGTADYYVIFVNEVRAQSGATRLFGIATLYSKNTSIQVPQGLLETGKTYMVTISATRWSGYNVETGGAPLYTNLGYASFNSSTFQP